MGRVRQASSVEKNGGKGGPAKYSDSSTGQQFMLPDFSACKLHQERTVDSSTVSATASAVYVFKLGVVDAVDLFKNPLLLVSSPVCSLNRFQLTALCACVCAVSYTHLTLPTSGRV